MSESTDLPPEAGGRLASAAFSSGLSVNDFAACLHMGLRPVALVQGYCVMRWSWYSAPGAYGCMPGAGYPGNVGYGRGFPGTPGGGFGGPFGGGPVRGYARPGGATLSTYSCPHYYMSAEHRTWGENYQQQWLAQAWSEGFNASYHRMLEEARDAGAHGVVGVVDRSSELIDRSIREFHIYGTAVVMEGAGPPPQIWTSYLAGQRLAKLVDSGYMPTGIVASMASVRMWAVCVTEALMRGGNLQGGYQPGAEITQLSDAQMQARRLVRDHVKSGLGDDLLHGADLEVGYREIGEGDAQVDAILRGTRVRRVRAAAPPAPPLLTVRVND